MCQIFYWFAFFWLPKSKNFSPDFSFSPTDLLVRAVRWDFDHTSKSSPQWTPDYKSCVYNISRWNKKNPSCQMGLFTGIFAVWTGPYMSLYTTHWGLVRGTTGAYDFWLARVGGITSNRRVPLYIIVNYLLLARRRPSFAVTLSLIDRPDSSVTLRVNDEPARKRPLFLLCELVSICKFRWE